MSDIEWYRAVHKHTHQKTAAGVYCSKPWSALCQSTSHENEGGARYRICHGTDHATHAEAMADLARHLRENACDPERDDEQPCSGTMPTTLEEPRQ